jgi:hypothetical protein
MTPEFLQVNDKGARTSCGRIPTEAGSGFYGLKRRTGG